MKLHRLIFWAHLVVGVTFGLIIFSTCLTGTMLAFQSQITAFAERKISTVPVPNPPTFLGLDVLASEIRDDKKIKASVSMVTIESIPTAAILFAFGKEGQFFINPYTGNVLGKASKSRDVFHFIEEMHRWLGKKEIGKPLTSASSLGFFFMVLSGLYVWFPNKVFWFRSGLRAKARDWNWHNVIGFWISPMLIISTVTGVIMSYAWANNLLFRAAGSLPPLQQREGGRATAGSGERQHAPMPAVSLQPLWERAHQQTTDWQSIIIRLPNREGAPVSIFIEEPKIFGFSPRSQLILDAQTADVRKWEPYSESNRGKKWRVWARYLHTGEALGWPGQLLMALGAIGGLFLVWTGFALAWRRLRAQVS